jgi:hypothetical protein
MVLTLLWPISATSDPKAGVGTLHFSCQVVLRLPTSGFQFADTNCNGSATATIPYVGGKGPGVFFADAVFNPLAKNADGSGVFQNFVLYNIAYSNACPIVGPWPSPYLEIRGDLLATGMDPLLVRPMYFHSRFRLTVIGTSVMVLGAPGDDPNVGPHIHNGSVTYPPGHKSGSAGGLGAGPVEFLVKPPVPSCSEPDHPTSLILVGDVQTSLDLA